MPKRRRVARTKILWNPDASEYVVRAWDQDGRRFDGADYHTADLDDAEATAKAMTLAYLTEKDEDA